MLVATRSEANGKDPGAKRSGKKKTKKKRERNKIKIGYSIVGRALFHSRSISELVVHFLHLKTTI